MKFKKYVRRSEIEAFQLTEEVLEKLNERRLKNIKNDEEDEYSKLYLGPIVFDNVKNFVISENNDDDDSKLIGISLEHHFNHLRAYKGDWIIKDLNGEFYPCKPDIFIKIYKKVE